MILGSASAPRRLVLSAVTAGFEARRADIDERGVRAPDSDALSLPAAIARAKAAHLLPEAGSVGILITADQIVLTSEGVVRNKPSGPSDVCAMMSEYAGTAVRLVSAVVVTDLSSGRSAEGVDVCTIWFRDSLREAGEAVAMPAVAQGLALLPWRTAAAKAAAATLDERVITEGIGSTQPQPTVSAADCAGAIILEHPTLAQHIADIDGSPDGALGLPLITLNDCLARLGLPALGPLGHAGH